MPNLPIKINSKFKTQNSKLKFKSQNFEFWLLVLAFAFLLLPFYGYAAPCYGTRLPEKHKFFIGTEAYAIFKRYLEDQQGKLRSAQYFLDISYGIFDWLAIDLKGGSGNIKQHPNGSDEVDYDSGFAGGYGFRLKFYDQKKIKMVSGFQHISVHPRSTHLGDVKHKAILDDWQVSLLGSYDLEKITPYLGARWSRIDYIHTVGDNKKRVMSDFTKDIGLIIGLNLAVSKKFWVNLEGQFFDSEALAASINYSF